MNILYGILIYMLGSSFLMTAIVWIKHIKHIRSGYDQVQEKDDVYEEHPQMRKSAAA